MASLADILFLVDRRAVLAGGRIADLSIRENA
jgi:hypothetical protein